MVFLFAVGMMIVNSYYSGQFRIIEDMSETVVVWKKSIYEEQLRNKAYSYPSASVVTDMADTAYQPILSEPIDGSRKRFLNVMAQCHHLSKPTNILPFTTNDGLYIAPEAVLLEGRFFSPKDVGSAENPVIIDEFTAGLLFPDTTAVGKTFTRLNHIGETSFFNEKTDTDENRVFTVIGVVQNSYATVQQRMNHKSKLVSDDEQIFVYVTIWSLGEGTATADEYMVAHIQDRDDFDSFEQYVDQLQLFAEKSSKYQFVSVRNALIDEKKQELSDTKTIINMIETLLFVVTGFCIMGIVFFSVKERIPEIGIKKSLGAGRADILFQFVFEMMLISVIVSFFAAFCAFMCCKFLEGFISEKLFILFTVRVG